jgi:hypothetical protein
MRVTPEVSEIYWFIAKLLKWPKESSKYQGIFPKKRYIPLLIRLKEPPGL